MRVAPFLCFAGLLAVSVAGPVAAADDGVHYIYLIRHGIYDRDETVADDVTGNGLNDLGREQARLVGARLAAAPMPYTRIVSSNLRRAVETAAEMTPLLGMTATADSLLQECAPAAERESYMAEQTPESIATSEAQLESAWAKYVTATPTGDTFDILVCHGNVIRWFACRALDVDTKKWLSLDIGNASVTVIAVRPDGTTRLLAFSDTGHLPPGKQTWAGKGWGWGTAPK